MRKKIAPDRFKKKAVNVLYEYYYGGYDYCSNPFCQSIETPTGFIPYRNPVKSIWELVEYKNVEILSNDIHIEILGDTNVMVLFDEFKLQQIITNYLTNAIHHVDENKQIKVFIEDGEIVRLSVFNSGKHISDENLLRIWEKFYKVDKARTRTYGGSGIGLSIVSAIMKKYGENFGCINVNGGVEFFIELRKP